MLAIRDFDKALIEHVDARSKKSTAAYSGAKLELRQIAVAYAEQRSRVTGEPQYALTQAIQGHEKNAEALIAVANDHRGLLTSYSTAFASMNRRLQSSLDGAWKIMGRVVARQSLLKLNAQLDDIQNQFATRNAPGNTSGEAGGVEIAERAFAATLLENEVALSRSQGTEWFSGMREDAARLATSRASLARVEARKALSLHHDIARDGDTRRNDVAHREQRCAQVSGLFATAGCLTSVGDGSE